MARPGIFGQTAPRAGLGTLQFSQDLGSRVARTMTFEFSTGRAWLGNPPFAWRYSEPVGKREYPILDIFAARHVSIKVTGEEEIASQRKLALGPGNPLWRIFRPQQVAAFSDRVDLYRLLPAPYFLTPPQMLGGGGRHLRRSVRVETVPAGVRITSTEGYYAIDIAFRDPKKYGAFWYSIPYVDDPEPSELTLLVIHSPNVAVEAVAAQNRRHYTDIHTFEASHTSAVPWQGEELEPNLDTLKRYGKHRFIRPDRGGTALRETIADLVDAIISPIPIVGDVYDFGQFVLAATSGHDIFGRRVSRKEVLLMGAAVLLPVGLSARPQLRALAKEATVLDLGPVTSPRSFAQLEDHVAPELREAVASLGAAERAELRDGAAKAVQGKNLDDFFETFFEVVGADYTRARASRLVEEVEAGRIPSDLLDDLTGFNDTVLQEGYKQHRRERLARRAIPRDVLDFAVTRRSDSRFGRRLAYLYGSEWRAKLVSIIGTANRLKFT
jgi:hypothetical protein